MRMHLDHQFTVNVPVERAWSVLTDVERIAPCLPGAQLTGVDGNVYTGHVKVKVGPITAQFAGRATFVERDAVARVAVVRGEGRDTGGKGSASATITATLTDVGNNQTECAVRTDLTITGKVAQFGRGALADVSDKLLAQFVANLDAVIAAEPVDGARPGSEALIAEPVDLLAVAGAPILARLVPVLVAGALVVAFVVGVILR